MGCRNLAYYDHLSLEKSVQGKLRLVKKVRTGVNRYGFNGMEKDDEISGNGNMYDYGFRIYNPRLGRFLSVDPLFMSFPFYTPYQFAANMPIAAIDLDGLEAKLSIWGIGAGNEGAFEGRAKRLANKDLNTTPHGVSTGAALLDLLIDRTATEGSVSSFIVFSHGTAEGVIISMNSGFYTSDSEYAGQESTSRTVSDISDAVTAGEVVFEDNAVAIFMGCNCGEDEDIVSLATEHAQKLGVITIASAGAVSPEIVGGKETGTLISDKQFYKFERQTDGSVTKTPLGKRIDPARYLDVIKKMPLIPLEINMDIIDAKPMTSPSDNPTTD